MNVAKELKNATTRYIEAKLRAYPFIEKDINNRRMELMNPWTPSDENIGGGKSNVNVSQTEVKATRLATDPKLLSLIQEREAIERALQTSTEDERQIIELNYFDEPRKYTMDGVAIQMNVSRATIFRIKGRVIKRVGEALKIA